MKPQKEFQFYESRHQQESKKKCLWRGLNPLYGKNSTLWKKFQKGRFFTQYTKRVRFFSSHTEMDF
jgi:hypothetical protein